MTLGILSLCCFSIFTAIPALIIAAKNRPLSPKAKMGAALARISILFFVLFVIGMILFNK